MEEGSVNRIVETYKRFDIFYYESPPEQYIACKGGIVLRAKTLEEAKNKIDSLKKVR
jgi:hypothetical protein